LKKKLKIQCEGHKLQIRNYLYENQHKYKYNISFSKYIYIKNGTKKWKAQKKEDQRNQNKPR
jgi:hypothetical protein